MNESSMLRNKAVALGLGALLAVTLPWWAGNQYQLHMAALICVYWILISGLNLVIGYTGQLSIGHVGLLAIGAYAFAILVGKMGWHPALAVVAAGVLGGLGSNIGALIGGVALGLLNAFASYWFGGEYQQTIAVGLLMVVLLVKPEGLLGSKNVRPV